MKKLLVLLLTLSLTGFLGACSGGGANGGGAGSTAKGTGFTMDVADGWTVAKEGDYVRLEKGDAFIEIGFSQMGFPPPPVNVTSLSFKFAEQSWQGFETEGVNRVQAEYESDVFCGIHTSGIDVDDPVIITMVESIVVDSSVTLPIADFR